MRLKASLAITGLGLASALVAHGAPIYVAQGASASAAAAHVSSSLIDAANARDPVARVEHLHTRGQLPDLVEGAAKTAKGAMRPLPSVVTPSAGSDRLVYNPATGTMELVNQIQAPSHLMFNPASGSLEVVEKVETAASDTDPKVLSFNPASGSIEPVQTSKKVLPFFRNIHPQDPSIRYTPRILDGVHIEIPNNIKGKKRRLDALNLSSQQEAELALLEKMESHTQRKNAFKQMLLQHPRHKPAPRESSKRKHSSTSLPRSEDPQAKMLHGTNAEAHNAEEMQGEAHSVPESADHSPRARVSRTVTKGKGKAVVPISPAEHVSPSRPAEHSDGSAVSASGSSTAQVLPHHASPARSSSHPTLTEPASSNTHQAAPAPTGSSPATPSGAVTQHSVHEPPSSPQSPTSLGLSDELARLLYSPEHDASHYATSPTHDDPFRW